MGGPFQEHPPIEISIAVVKKPKSLVEAIAVLTGVERAIGEEVGTDARHLAVLPLAGVDIALGGSIG